MTHDELAAALGFAYPGIEWGYDGDGTTLDPVYADDGETLVARGLEWHGTGNPPTLAELEAALPLAQAAQTRFGVADEIHARLAATDVWCSRHIEDDISLTPERITYRRALRKLLAVVEASDDPGSITIPDPPPAPK